MIKSPGECHSRLVAGLHPRVLPCGHVQLIDGRGEKAAWTVMDIDDAIKYSCELQQTLMLALSATRRVSPNKELSDEQAKAQEKGRR